MKTTPLAKEQKQRREAILEKVDAKRKFDIKMEFGRHLNKTASLKLINIWNKSQNSLIKHL
jgi:hypothetical protein